MSNKKQGFTLVELAIVLVIIGLLLGGILVAQSMIKTAQIEGLIKQVGQYDAAISNIKQKYKELPGDGFTLSEGWGDGDGLIGSNYWETAESWRNMSLYGSVMNKKGEVYGYQDWFNGTITTEDNCPLYNIEQSKAGQPCIFLLGWVPGGLNAYVYMEYNNSPTNGYGANFEYPPLKAADVLAIDSKMDDGKPTTGIVTPNLGTSVNNTLRAADGLPALPECFSGNSYNISSTDYICTLHITAGASNGQMGFKE